MACVALSFKFHSGCQGLCDIGPRARAAKNSRSDSRSRTEAGGPTGKIWNESQWTMLQHCILWEAINYRQGSFQNCPHSRKGYLDCSKVEKNVDEKSQFRGIEIYV